MSLTPAERAVLDRRLRRLRRSEGGLGAAFGLLGLIATAPVIALFVGFAILGAVYASLADELEVALERIENLEARETFESIRIYDRNGVLLREIAPQGRRTRIPLADIPVRMREATIAVEDADFYSNPGIDVAGIMRAGTQLVLEQEIVSGGSTITQQLARHVAFSDEERLSLDAERRFQRKAKELVLAVIMTSRYDKNQILEWYLNEIYYGNLAYGVEAASQAIFGKPARELDLAESAMLAGLPQAPGYFDPLNPDPDIQSLVKDRQRTVLNLMRRKGFVTTDERDAALAQELVYDDPHDDAFIAPHFAVHVERLLEERLGAERMSRGGLDVTTTLDLGIQGAAEQIVKEHVERLKERHNLTNSSVVVLEPRTGQILAMVGSKDYWDDDIDGRVNVAMRQRQPGSSIKPVTFATALEQGLPTSTLLWDVKMKRDIPGDKPYEPKNYDETFHGPVRLRTALANSYNIPALKLLEMVQTRNMIEMANALGILSLDPDDPRYGISITLGGGDVTLMEMVQAFSVFANGGVRVDPTPILHIRTSAGATVYDLEQEKPRIDDSPRVLSATTAYILSDILSDNAARTPAFGSSSPLNAGVPAAVKTGTTDDPIRDNWTIGYTPYVTVGVWSGNSDNSELINSSGLTGAAPIWREVLRSIVFDDARKAVPIGARRAFGYDSPERFERPPGIVERAVCHPAGLRTPAGDCTSHVNEIFREDNVPEQDDWIRAPAVVVPLPPAAPSEDGAAPEPGYRLCSPMGGMGMDKAQSIAVLPLPQNEEERVEVIAWASTSGFAGVEPWEPCTPELIAGAAEPGTFGAFADGITVDGRFTAAEYSLGIAPGTVLSQTTTLTGTVLYDTDEIDYYKVELGRGAEPTEWITLGDVHRGYVTSGPIEVLDAGALPPGDYIVRLVLVRRDGNFLRPPHSVPIRIGR